MGIKIFIVYVSRGARLLVEFTKRLWDALFGS